MTTSDAARPKDSVVAGRKGYMGKQTCRKSRLEGVEDLLTKR